MEKKIFEIKIPKGSTALGLAGQYHTDIDAIKRLNPEIKDIDLIREGESLKLPKMTSEKAPEEYRRVFGKKLEDLYSGDYGIEGAREKLGKELEVDYPSVDTWTDIYTRIPDNWDKIAFPTSVKGPEELPKEKKPAWLKVGSFIKKNILKSVQEKISSVAWDIFKKYPDIPTPEEVYKESVAKIRAYVVKPVTETIESLEDRIREVPSTLTDWVEKHDEMTASNREKIKESAEKFYSGATKVAKKSLFFSAEVWLKPGISPYLEVVKEIVPKVAEKLPLTGPYLRRLKQEKIDRDLNKKLGEAMAKEGKEPEELKIDVSVAGGYINQINKEILNNIDEWAKGGWIWKEDLSGMAYLDEEESDKRMREILESNIKKYQIHFPDSNPVIFESNSARQSLVYSLISDLRILYNFLEEPESRKDENYRLLKDNLTNMVQASSYLEALDPFLESLDLELDKFNRSTVGVENHYKKNYPEWTSELKEIIGEELLSILDKPVEMTDKDKEKFDSFLSGLNLKNISRVLDLIKLRTQAQSFYGLEGNMERLLSDSQSLQSLQTYYKKSPSLNKKKLEAIDTLLVNQEEGYEEFDLLKSKIKTNKSLNPEQLNAALDLILFYEDSNRINKRLFSLTHKLGKASEIFQKAIEMERIEHQNKEVEKLESFIEKGRIRTVLFPITSAIAKDAVTMVTEGWKRFVRSAAGKTLGKGLVHLGNFYDWAYYKHLTPAINASLAKVVADFEAIGQSLSLVEIPFIQKIGIKSLDSFQAFKQCLNLPSETVLPKNISMTDAFHTGLLGSEYCLKAFKYYQSPKAFEEIVLKEDCKILWKEGKIHIGPYSFDRLKTPEQLYSWNPHIVENERKLKAGTKIRVPRFKPGPRFSDILKDQDRYEWYKNHPVLATVIDDFLPFMFPDPIFKFAAGSKILGANIVNKFGLVSLKKTKTVFGSVRFAEKLQRWQDVSEQFLKLATCVGTDYKKLPAYIAKKVIPIDKLRGFIGQTTVINGAPIEIQARFTALGKEVAELTSLSYLIHNADSVIEQVAKAKGMSRKTLEGRLRLALFDPALPPERAVQEVFSVLGLNTFDIYKWTAGRPFLKEPIRELLRATFSKEAYARQLAFNEGFQKLGKNGQEYFMEVWNDWKKVWGDKTKIIRTEANRAKLKSDYIMGFERTRSFSKIKTEVDKADSLLFHYLAEVENARIVAEGGKVMARLPSGVTIKIADQPEKLIAKGILFKHPTRGWEYVYNPARFKKREGEMLGDLMSRFFMNRIVNFKKRPYAKIRNDIFRKETEKVYQFFYQEVKRVKGKLIKRKQVKSSDEWIKTLGKKEFIEKLKKKDLEKVSQKLLFKTVKDVNYNKEHAVYLWDALISDFYQNFLKREFIMLSQKTAPGFNAIKKYLGIKPIVKEKSSRELLLEFLRKESPRREKEYVAVSRKIIGREERYAELQEYHVWETILVKKELPDIGDGVLELFLKRAAYLDFLKGTSAGRKFLIRHKKHLLTAVGQYPDSASILDLLLIHSFGFRNILPSFSRTLMLEDFVLPKVAEGLSKNLSYFAEHASNKFYEICKKRWLKEGKRESIEKFKEILPIDQISREIEAIQKGAKMGSKDKALNTILPKIYGYIPEEKLTLEEIEIVLSDRIAIALDKIAVNLKKAVKGDAKEMMVSFREIQKTKIPTVRGESLHIYTQRKDPGILIAKEKEKILRASSESRLIQVSNITSKDKAIIDFCNANRVLYKIVEPYKAKEFIKTKSKFMELLGDESFWKYHNPGELFKKEDFLDLMSLVPSNVAWVEQWERFCMSVTHKLRKTDSGRSVLKQLGIENEKELISVLKKIDIDKTAYSKLWEKMGIQPFLAKDIQQIYGEDFYMIILGFFQSALKKIGAQGIRIKKNKKGLITVVELKKLGKDKLVQVHEQFLREGGLSLGIPMKEVKKLVVREKPLLPEKVEEVIKGLCNLLHIETYKSAKSFLHYSKKLGEMEALRTILKAFEFKRKILLEEIERLRRGVRMPKNLIQERRLLQKAVTVESKEKHKRTVTALTISIKKHEFRIKQIQRLEYDLKKVNDQLKKTDFEIFKKQGSLEDTLGILGHDPIPGNEINFSITDYLGTTNPVSFARLRKNIEIGLRDRKSSLESIKKILLTKKTDLILQKARLRLEQEIIDLTGFRKLLPDLEKLRIAGFKINWAKLYDFAKGRSSPEFLKEMTKLKKKLAAPFHEVKSPVALTKGNQELVNAFPEFQANIKRLKVKEESISDIISDYLGRNFGADDYIVPLIRTPVMPTEMTLIFKKFDDLADSGVKAIVDLTGELTKEPFSLYKKRLRIISIPELSKTKLPSISKKGDIPLKGEADGFLKLRNVFLEERNILIWDKKAKRAAEISNIFKEVYLSKQRREAMEAAKDLFFSLKRVVKGLEIKGPTFRFARRSDEYLKIYGDPKGMSVRLSKALGPEKAIVKVIRSAEIDRAMLNLEVIMRKHGLIGKEKYLLGDISKRVPILVIAPKVRLIPQTNLDVLKKAVEKQNAELILPRELTTGEQVIKEYLIREKISFSQLKVGLNPKAYSEPLGSAALEKISSQYPEYLFPIGRAFDPIRQAFLSTATVGKKLFKPLNELQDEILKIVLKDISEWRKDITKFIPKFIQEEYFAIRKDPKVLLARFKLVVNRAKAKRTWRDGMKEVLDEVETMEKNRMIEETGRFILSPKQKEILASRRREWDNSVKILDNLYNWDRKPGFFEDLSSKLSKSLDLKYAVAHDYFHLGGVPISEFSNLKYSEWWTKRMLGLIHKLPQLTRGVRSGFGYLRTVWIYSILYWRIAWHIKNSYDDGIRGALAARSTDYFVKSQMMFGAASAVFMKRFARDIRMLPKFVNKPMKGEIKSVAQSIGGKEGSWWARNYEGVLRETRRHPYLPWDPTKAFDSKNKGFWQFLDKKMWEKSGLNKMMEFDKKLTLEAKRTKAGEVLTKEMFDHLCEAGLFQSTSDPVHLRKVISMLSEQTWFARLKKRAFVLQADIETFACLSENMRRQLLVHDLLFKKSMTLAKTKAKTWGYLFNYRDLTVVGKFFRYFFPFYAFNINTTRLFLTLCAKRGPRALFAGRALLNAWSKATEDLPEWARGRIPIGNQLYWYPWVSFTQVFSFFQDPGKMLKEFAENPLKVPLGFGWDPNWTTLISSMTGKRYWDISNDIKAQTGWTDDEIERFIKDQNLQRDLSGKEKFYELLFTYIPFTRAIKALGEVDMHMLTDGVSIWKSKKLKEWAKLFGINILKWEDIDRFRDILFNTPPHLRSKIIKELKAEDPAVWKSLEGYFAKTLFLRANEEAKTDPVKAQFNLQIRSIWHTYYGLEEENKGTGKLWLQRLKDNNPQIEKDLNEEQKRKEEEGEITPWQMWANARYNVGKLAGEVRAAADKIYKKEVFARAEILGIEIPFGVPGKKDEFLNQFFDASGNLKIGTTEELEVIMGRDWVKNLKNKTQKKWQEVIKETANQRFNEWLYEEVKGETKTEREFAKKMKSWQLILPANINIISEEKAQGFWSAYWNYFEKYFTDEDKSQYYSMLKERHGEWFYEYRMKMKEYCDRWTSLFEGFKDEGFQFFEKYYQEPDWFQKLYFLKNPNKAKWYPFAREWTSKMFEIEKLEKETFIFQTEKRKEVSEFFWKHENIIRDYWDKDNPGFYKYMKDWQKIISVTEAEPQRYFDLFYKQDVTFQKRFFERNPEKKIYYPFIQKWVNLIVVDTNNWKEKKKRTRFASDYFWSNKNKTEREAYGKSKFIAKGISILEYLKTWDKIFYQTQDNVEDYFPLFYSQPDWFKTHFFNCHPNKEIYYPKVWEWIIKIKYDKEILEKTGKSPKTARDYYLKNIKGIEKVQKAWLEDNPGIIEYLDTWSEIISKTEKDPKAYFTEFYKQSESFKNRFFENNRNKEIYYPFLWQWIKKMEMDEDNWKVRNIRTSIASRWFWAEENKEARKLYGEANPITKDKSVIDYLKIWDLVITKTEENPKDFFVLFDTQPDWFKTHYFFNHPDRKIYYPFAKKLGEQKPEDFSNFFWKSKYASERAAWERDKPGFLDHMRFWKKLGSLAETGQWELYFRIYYSDDNLEFRKRHWRNNVFAKRRFELFRAYQGMPSVKWEERGAKREFLKKNPLLLEWWSENISSEEAVLRNRVEEYYNLLDKVPATGKGSIYYQEVRKWKLAAQHYLESNPDVLLFLQRNSKQYTGQEAEILTLSRNYFELEFAFQKESFIAENPELKEYFYNLNPPGIRNILDTQSKYFALADKFKSAYLEIHPELLEYWEIMKLPYSYFFDPEKFKPFQNVFSKVEKCYNEFETGEWVVADRMRESLPELYRNPGETEEDDWLKVKIYRITMKAWIKIAEKNSFFSIYFFRQLPSWIRDIYYEKHPEKQYLSKEPLSEFLAEPLKIWESLNPDLAWAYKMLHKYGRNIPDSIFKKVKKIMIDKGEWESRSGWTSSDWDDYWKNTALKMNEVDEFDFQRLPLLKTELKKVQETYPLRIAPKPWAKPTIGKIEPFF